MKKKKSNDQKQKLLYSGLILFLLVSSLLLTKISYPSGMCKIHEYSERDKAIRRTVNVKPQEASSITRKNENLNEEYRSNPNSTNTTILKKENHQNSSKSLRNITTPKKMKIAYLTFDDGPSSTITPLILNILRSYKIKATFFVIGTHAEKNENLVKREWAEGHMVGNHTYDHNVDYIYKEPKNLINELGQCDSILKTILNGYKKTLVRFPGGSTNRPQSFKDAVIKSGYHFVDWNCLTRDAEVPNIPVGRQLNNVKHFSLNKDEVILLMHDDVGEKTTAEALPKIIEYLKSSGYRFKTLE